MLDWPEDVCPGQVWFEYPATSVPFSNFGLDGRARPGKTPVRTAVPWILLTRKRTEVQLLPRPPYPL
jgi:hypothetical protein